MGLFQLIAAAFGFSRKTARILVIGLDNCGKSTLINHLKPKKPNTFEATPTVGFQVEEFSKDNINFTVYDMSGQGRYRNLWEQYYADVEAIIFVIDSTDKFRIVVAKEELVTMLNHEDIKRSKIPILFYANKMDIPGAMTAEECADDLDLHSIRDKAWHINASNAITGAGVAEGVEWLCSSMQYRRK